MKPMNKLFKSILCLVMVLSMLVCCSLTLVGCNKDDESGSGNKGDKNNAAQYEGLEKEEYLQKLESNNIGSAIDTFGSIYKKVFGAAGNGASADAFGSKMDLTLNVGDDVLNLLEENIFGGDIGDMSFLSKINLNMDMSIQDQVEKMQLALSLNGEKIITLYMLMNMADSVIYAAAPELNEDWIKFDMSEMMGGASVADMVGSTAQMTALMEAMPNADTLTKVLDRYVELVLSKLDNVDQSTTSIEAGGVRQQVTQLTLKIYEKDAQNIVKEVLTTAKTDADLKKIIEDVAKAMEELSGEELDADEVYTSFQDAIDELLADLDEDPELDTENPITLITYVDKDHNIVGRKFSISNDGEERTAFYYYAPADGEKTGLEVAVPDSQTPGEYDFRITGSGTKKDDKLSGNYTVSVEDQEYFYVTLENLSTESGSITLKPADALEDEMGLTDLPFENLSLQIKLDKGLELNILSGSDLLIGLALSASESNGPSVSEPSDATDAMDSNAMQSWAQKLVLDKVLDNLEKAGVPSELIDALENGGLFGGSESSTEYPAPYAA